MGGQQQPFGRPASDVQVHQSKSPVGSAVGPSPANQSRTGRPRTDTPPANTFATVSRCMVGRLIGCLACSACFVGRLFGWSVGVASQPNTSPASLNMPLRLLAMPHIVIRDRCDSRVFVRHCLSQLLPLLAFVCACCRSWTLDRPSTAVQSCCACLAVRRPIPLARLSVA